MNPILLARHVQESLRELVHTTLNSSSRAFEGMVDRFLDDPAHFIKGPWLSVDMPFRQIDGAVDGTWTQPFPEIPLRFAPYQHQMDVFARLSGTMMRSTLVATGTGSGKTESYLWPIFEHCRQQQGQPGIKAILIYPMNALASDQARRIATALTTLPALKEIRAGIYADAEPQDATFAVTPASIITHRETLRRDPPDILLTNYKMLDYLLLRGRDKPLWEKNAPHTLRFLVVDEMHTFDGAQGADLALLLRRLKYRLSTPADHLICVGSSATLGSGEDAATELRRYAETLFGETFDSGAVIRETRKTPNEVFESAEYLDRPEPATLHTALQEAENLDQPRAAQRLAICLFPDAQDRDFALLHTGNPADMHWRLVLGQRLLQHYLCQRTLKMIAEHPGPAALDTVAAGLAQVHVLRDWAFEDQRALAELIVALIAWARSGTPDNPRPLFNVRVQLWIREMSRMVTTLPQLEADGRRSAVQLVHALDVDQTTLRRMLPVVNCNRCGATAHVGRLHSGSRLVWAPLDQLYEEFFGHSSSGRITLFYHESIERKVKGGKLPIVRGMLDAESVEFTPNDHQNLTPGTASPVWMYNPTDEQGRLDRTCPACGQEHGLLLFGMRAARLTTGITGTLYTSAHNEESATAKPRLLLFSDSVQDAAHRAAIAETRNALSVYQKALFQTLAPLGNKGMTLHQVIAELPSSQLHALGADHFTALFIAKEQTWRNRYQELVRNGTSITDSVFLEHLQTRLGWEYFVDLSYRSHFSHTLEASGMAVADVPVTALRTSAQRLASQLRNALPGAALLDENMLVQFLFGVVQRMRRQGSVAHSYIVSAVETGQTVRTLNWFGAAARLGLGRTHTLPMPNPRTGLAPVPITLQGHTPGFESMTRSSGYGDWLFRVLGSADLRTGTAPEVVYPIVLSRLEADALVRRVNGPDALNRRVWLLEPHQITVTAMTGELMCGQCGRRETTLAENVEHLEGTPCTRIGCSGQLSVAHSHPQPALRRALASDRNHRVVAREHTGLLNPEERLRVEKGFIQHETRWAPNLISATPTLEMGIDIGDLSTVLLSSVPPEEANYVQRTGRSGRRDGNALNLVLANSRSHDLQFWEDPRPMLSGQVRPPGVFLEAEEVLLRQVTAFSLDVYVAASSDNPDYGTVREVLKRRESTAAHGFPVEWLALVQARGNEIAETFLSGLPESVQCRSDLTERIRAYLTSTDTHSIGWRVGAAFDAAAEERASLVQKRDEVTRELDRLRRRQAELTDEEFKKRTAEFVRDRKAINRMITKGIDKVLVIKYLTDKGLLPNYAFPEEGIKLTSILSRRNDHAHDEDGLLYLEYSRPASSALSEFAPGQFFYANGRQVQIERIDIGKDDLTTWTFCPSCSYVSHRLEGIESRSCPKCGDEMWSDTGSHHEIVQLKSVLAIDSEEKAVIRDLDQRDQRQFDRVLMPFHEPGAIITSWFTSRESGAPFGFEFIPHCTFRDFNFGAKQATPIGPKIAGERRPAQPFRICRYCGTLQKRHRREDDRGTHPANCRVSRDKALVADQWETDVFLMRGFATEALRIVIPVVGEADDDDLKSFVAAINLGMRRHFAGKVDHIHSTIFEAQLDGMTSVRSLYLYDAVPGGSGYLRQIGSHPETMRAVIARAADALRDCPCNQEPERNGCYRCVKPYRAQFGPGEPDRDRARNLMETILQQWDSLTRTETGIDDSIRDSLVESALENRFLRALAKLYGEAALTPQVLGGGRRGFVLKAGNAPATRLWTIESQVQIDARFRGMPRKRIDFLLTPVGRASERPVVIEMDGIEYHATTVNQDVLDRLTMIRSGELSVWTLAWKDLDQEVAPLLNPLAESHLGAEKIGNLGKVLAHSKFAPLADAVRALQTDTPLQALRRRLDGETESVAASSVLIRGLVARGRSFDQLPRSATLSPESHSFLVAVELMEHVGAGVLDLYLACNKVSPAQWDAAEQDLRLLLRATLPKPGETPSAKTHYVEAWRGLWRLINLFQGLRGFHVEIDGLDTLLPPDLTIPTDAPDGGLRAKAWAEARALCDESFHPLIDALITAEIPAPDHVGDDLIVGGRVVGMLEFGWAQAGIAVADTHYEGVDWQLIVFDPEVDSVLDTVTKIVQVIKKDAD